MKNSKNSHRRLAKRMIFVSYIYQRHCYRNPSIEGFDKLPLWYQKALQHKWAKKLHDRLEKENA